jgi:hypothetical protein
MKNVDEPHGVFCVIFYYTHIGGCHKFKDHYTVSPNFVQTCFISYYTRSHTTVEPLFRLSQCYPFKLFSYTFKHLLIIVILIPKIRTLRNEVMFKHKKQAEFVLQHQ